jgi:hypothetical protein
MKKLAERWGICVTHAPMLITREAGTALSIIARVRLRVRFERVLKVRWECRGRV